MAQCGYEYYLAHLVDTTPPVGLTGGASGYFSHPQTRLDPHLFDGEHIKPSVRDLVVNTYLNFWKRRLHYVARWSTIWLAGSGITYQWAADRGNGDLDTLIGIDWDLFYVTNQDFIGLTPTEVADFLNEEMRTRLWPRTASTHIGGGVYELTAYINPDGSDIRDIHAYAAYNLSADEWTIRPPDLPDDPASMYPREFVDAAAEDTRAAQALTDHANDLLATIKAGRAGSPAWHNAMAELRNVLAHAHTLLDEIHLGRRAAFGAGGSGYGDWANYRWQASKQSGAIGALHTLTQLDADALRANDADLYGAPIDASEKTLLRAALAHTRFAH